VYGPFILVKFNMYVDLIILGIFAPYIDNLSIWSYIVVFMFLYAVLHKKCMYFLESTWYSEAQTLSITIQYSEMLASKKCVLWF